MTLHFHYTVVGIVDDDGQARWHLDPEADNYHTPVWDTATEIWRGIDGDNEADADGRLVADLQTRIAGGPVGLPDAPLFSSDDLQASGSDETTGRYLSGRVELDFDLVMSAGYEGFLDLLSEGLIGSQLLQDISYKIVGHAGNGGVVFLVTGDISGHLDHLDAG